ncbi:hypothetical protein EYF80_039223 [Liparis tanakae]|uniref:Uncharacterized protein n=1 Tax=Liparis tanakae TaxID=230148 RepID=A0A4Z2GCD0_9TELE|nr:hypothetical protein EYF80_039223 [Liparis tanakae]
MERSGRSLKEEEEDRSFKTLLPSSGPGAPSSDRLLPNQATPTRRTREPSTAVSFSFVLALTFGSVVGHLERLGQRRPVAVQHHDAHDGGAVHELDLLGWSKGRKKSVTTRGRGLHLSPSTPKITLWFLTRRSRDRFVRSALRSGEAEHVRKHAAAIGPRPEGGRVVRTCRTRRRREAPGGALRTHGGVVT